MINSLNRFIPLLAAIGGLPFIAACSATTGPAMRTAQVPVVYRTMVIRTGKELNKPGWPQFQPADWQAPQGSVVELTIISHDSGTAPPMMMQAGQVRGTEGSVETVNGKVVRNIPSSEISHTFSIPALGLNLPIPQASPGKIVTITAKIPLTRAGHYLWQCLAPCATGPMGMGGAMATPGYMRGTITISRAQSGS